MTSFERALESGRKSATRTQARVAWKVVLCWSHRASTCSLALILQSQTRLIVMPCLCTVYSPLFKHVWMEVPCLCTSMGLLLLFKHVWIVVLCSCASISLQPCVSNTFGLWFLVWVHATVFSPVSQTRVECGSLSVYTHLSTLCFKHV